MFLDRDGVLNYAPVRSGRPYSPQTLEEFRILPEVAEATRQLKDAGFALVVATNQPDVTKGLVKREVVDAMHDRLRRELPLDAIKVCWCVEGPDCDCYKPKPGLLAEAAEELGLDLGCSVMVGDRWRDVGAGRNAGCFTILIDRGYDEPQRETPDAVCGDLSEAASIIIARSRESGVKGEARR